ncbi:DUF3783 domain-containing protein [Fervidobacterium thailandense]|uniref:DUF3783 domain-containing protein n=1 Tax=Fervidobacterium thailandense TaxID=1008305 RepID=A0A1E3G108_9BACT|nr:DUF3783 domain-containing protein [Fervidobacterium thailandense]ODN29934.1 hypothetical protein A4H02_07975 [Fervidobacterium thailandense]
MSENERIVILHNFENFEIIKLMKILKENFPERDLIFASTTPTSLEWKVSDLIEELRKEHEEFKKLRHGKQG